jgi:hypothetical protein
VSAEGGFTSTAIERRYDQFVADNWGEIDIPRLCEVMWNAGARAAIESSREFSGIGPTLAEIEGRLQRLEQLWRSFGETEAASAYWRTNAGT